MNFKYGETSTDKDTKIKFKISVLLDATPENLTPSKLW